MSREILFRGKRVDNGEWVYGFWFTDALKRSWIVFGKLEHVYDYECYEVIPETVGQFTGLPDKNGKKIFEGDIVNIKHQHEIVTGKIEYIDDRFIVAVKMWAGDLRHYAKTVNLFCEIIGNTHENAALLEVEK